MSNEVMTALKRPVKKVLIAVGKYILARPRLKHWCSRGLDCTPRLKERLTRLVYSADPQPVEPVPIVQEHMPIDLSGLTPRGRALYELFARSVDPAATDPHDLLQQLGLALQLEDPGQRSLAAARCLVRMLPSGEAPQLLVDIGELAHVDARSGIQRVVRSVASVLVKHPPEGYLLRFVRPDPEHPGYVYAHEAGLRLFGHDDGLEDDLPLDYGDGDIFFGLDYCMHIVPQKKDFFHTMQQHGVKVYFVVHDLLPITQARYFDTGTTWHFPIWLKTIGEFDGIVCVSRAVAEELRAWMEENGPERTKPLDIQWFHLGSDVENSLPSRGMPDDARDKLAIMRQRPTILMVSTVEPRKGHRQALKAFELLWKEGVDVNLVIVGHAGWNMEDFERLLQRHPERDRRLFRLQSISDEYLEAVYGVASAVLMASEGEGFGLALIEGASFGCPLILRDLPVFVEIAGDHALYFHGLEPEPLAGAIRKWLALDARGEAPSSRGIRPLTWEESTAMLMSRLPLRKAG